MNAWDFTPYFQGTNITAVAETGSSWLLFTPDQVLKILKPSKRAARDLSSPEARRLVLEEELELLKRFAPGVGLQVQSLKNQEQVVEVALVMRRLPRGANLLARLLTKRVPGAELRRIGETLAKIHAKSPAPAARAAAVATIPALRAAVDAAAQPLLDPAASMFLSHDISVRVRDKLLTILHARQATFLDRIRRKGIRQVHGALHAASIYVEDAAVSFLDAARDPEGIAVADGLSDLGALMKDVRLFLSVEESSQLIQGYLGKTQKPTPEVEDLVLFYELLWTMRTFAQHTAVLIDGTGGPLDTELVQRYRTRLMRAVAATFAPTALQQHERREEERSTASHKEQRRQQHEQKRQEHQRQLAKQHAPKPHAARPTPQAQPKKPAPKPHAARPKPQPKKPQAARRTPHAARPKPQSKKPQAARRTPHAARPKPQGKKPAPKPRSKKLAPKKPQAASRKPQAKAKVKKGARATPSIGQKLRTFLGLKKRRA